jgi:quercetin dioxygenase-like cupin family protein
MIVKNYRQVTPESAEEAPGVTVRWVISEKDGAPNFAMRVFEVEPGAASPFHTHSWEHEVFILAGSGFVRDEDSQTPFGEGDVVFVAPQEKHQFVNDGDITLRFICVIPLQQEQ